MEEKGSPTNAELPRALRVPRLRLFNLSLHALQKEPQAALEALVLETALLLREKPAASHGSSLCLKWHLDHPTATKKGNSTHKCGLR